MTSEFSKINEELQELPDKDQSILQIPRLEEKLNVFDPKEDSETYSNHGSNCTEDGSFHQHTAKRTKTLQEYEMQTIMEENL